MKAVNIKWDTDGDRQLAKELPSEIEIPDSLIEDMEDFDLEEENEEISEYLSYVTGFCHFGFDLLK